jgi:hypothetical protein
LLLLLQLLLVVVMLLPALLKPLREILPPELPPVVKQLPAFSVGEGRSEMPAAAAASSDTPDLAPLMHAEE